MPGETIGGELRARTFWPIGFLAVLLTANGASAGGLFPRSFPAGDAQSATMADLDGDTAPDLVTANWISDNVTVYLNQRVPAARPEIDIKPGSDPNSINPPLEGDLLGGDPWDGQR